VGKCFLQQLSALPDILRPSLVFVSRSTKNIASEDYRPIQISQAETLLNSSPMPLLNFFELATYLTRAPGRAILVDNTSSQDLANAYPAFLAKGVSIVTPNKKAFSSDLGLWEDIFSAVARSQGRSLIYHESSVGAGLPVISTLKDLITTGDQVTRIEGVFSGTMSFLFNSFAPADDGSTAQWSQIVSEAKNAGYTEPDPRDDLNGMDVARKLTILARLAGLKVAGPTTFPVQSLIPLALENAASADEFMSKLPTYDAEMEGYKEQAKSAGKVIRYIGSVDVLTSQVKVGLEMVDRGTPIASLKGSDNLICFYTKRYGTNPLVIQGAGAGGEVTAMGVTSDLIKVIERLW
jgi:homoserine dehydrogenase